MSLVITDYQIDFDCFRLRINSVVLYQMIKWYGVKFKRDIKKLQVQLSKEPDFSLLYVTVILYTHLWIKKRRFFVTWVC